MKHRVSRAALVAATALGIAASVFALAVGDVDTVLTFDPGEHPEGIAFDRDGNLYFGNRTDTVGGDYDSELIKVTPGGKHHKVIATFARSPGSALLGLVVDRGHGGEDA